MRGQKRKTLGQQDVSTFENKRKGQFRDGERSSVYSVTCYESASGEKRNKEGRWMREK